MTGTVLRCPQCGGSLNPGRFARLAVCTHCGSTVILGEQTIKAEMFRKSFREWNSPSKIGFSEWLTVHGKQWAVGRKIASGHISDVYFGIRARWPTECVLIKILRYSHDLGRFENTWNILSEMEKSRASGAETFSYLMPQPVFNGTIESGGFAGVKAMAFRWAEGFDKTLEAINHAKPEGIRTRSSIWLWRRILEILSFVHASGFVHGAVLPPHVLVENGEHGARLVGYGCAGRIGHPLKHLLSGYEKFYPEAHEKSQILTQELDIRMSARTIAFMLGGDPRSGEVPDAVPEQLAELIVETATGAGLPSGPLAWLLRERLGKIADEVYGAPEFCPIVRRSHRED